MGTESTTTYRNALTSTEQSKNFRKKLNKTIGVHKLAKAIDQVFQPEGFALASLKRENNEAEKFRNRKRAQEKEKILTKII